jgi:hypothetical protein
MRIGRQLTDPHVDLLGRHGDPRRPGGLGGFPPGRGVCQEFLAFLKQVAAASPRCELHVVVDNLSTHKHPAVRAW